MKDRVSILLLNWNGIEWLDDCLKSVFNLDYPNFEVIVIDNGSEDGSQEFIKIKYPLVKLIENNKNLGYSKGFNIGLKYSYDNNFDYSLIMNNDTVIDNKALKSLVSVAKSDEKIGFVTGKVYYHSSPNKFQTVGRYTNSRKLAGKLVGEGEIDEGQYDNIIDYEYVDDVFLLVRNEVISKTGGYDEDFFLLYEEVDWCYRVRNLNYRIVYTPDAKIWHKGSLSSGGQYNYTYSYYQFRNEIIFMKKNANPKIFFYYLFFQFFIDMPRIFINHLVKSKSDFALVYLKGIISGYIWCLSRGTRKG